jgi:hypothetical protein
MTDNPGYLLKEDVEMPDGSTLHQVGLAGPRGHRSRISLDRCGRGRLDEEHPHSGLHLGDPIVTVDPLLAALVEHRTSRRCALCPAGATCVATDRQGNRLGLCGRHGASSFDHGAIRLDPIELVGAAPGVTFGD